MIDEDKVLIGLGQHISGRTHQRCGDCPYFNGDSGYGVSCRDELLDDIYNLLETREEAQEPRVMGADEVREWVGKQRVDREPICVEVKDNICAWIVSDEYWDMQMDINLSSDLYGKTWRC